MATATVNPTTPASTVETPEGVLYRLTASDYFRMVDADILPPDRRVGLWKGRLYEKMAKKLPHSVAASKVITALVRSLPEGWCPWPENPISIDDFTAPLPDFSLVRGPADAYVRHGTVPKLDEIGLVVGLADTSLRKNLTETLQTYARAGLPCYWVINLVARRVEVYTDPRVEEGVARYATLNVFEAGKDVPVVLDGRAVAVIPARDLLPEETL
ncbi:MAG: Uma2 family endonuclease [Planctomycetia bacterium]|nr:Uma2 family endonuclease [Planctomycetia bacterium]